MNQAVVLCSLLAIAVASPSVSWSKLAPSSDLDATNDVGVSEQHAQWTAYKTEHHKFYEGAEDERRFATFSHHLQVIEEHNSLYDQGMKSYKLGLNHFTDMTQAEFQFHYLGLKRDYKATLATSSSTFLKPFNLNEPDTVDWRQKGIVTAVKNQGQCGSCWSFSTTGSLEGQHAKKTGKLVSLSEQQLVDCSGKFGNHGCQGGLMDQAFEYIKAVGGIESESEYPYEAEQEKKCHFHKREVNATVTGFHDVTSQDESALKSAVASVGPVSIAIDASHSSFQLYKEGVYDEPECSSTQLDHGVLVVGYGTEDGHDYWLVKNSWSEEWGEEGYIKMSRNKHNQCGVATSASYPLV